MKKSFLEFMSLCEAVYDKDVMGRSQIKKTGEGGRIAPKRKQTDAEKRRMTIIESLLMWLVVQVTEKKL